MADTGRSGAQRSPPDATPADGAGATTPDQPAPSLAPGASPLTARLTPEGVFTRVSWFAKSILGLERSEMLGRSIFEYVHPADGSKLRFALAESRHTYTHVTVRYRHRTGAGAYLWLESVVMAERGPDRQVRSFFLTSRDVTARVDLEKELNRVQAVLRLAIRNVPTGLGVADPDGRWTMVNPVLARMTGYSEKELLSMKLADLVHPDHRAAHDQAVGEVLWDEGAVADLDERLVAKDGAPLWVRLVIAVARDEEGGPRQLVVQVSDVHRFKERELLLEREALLDPLTGVGNRRLLLGRLEEALADRREPSGQVGVVVLDLDNFKDVNDRYGHAAGDRVVATVAQRLAGTVREQDTVARMGGDEFVVVCPGVRDTAEADALGARLREVFEQPVPFEDDDVRVTASMGMVLSRDLDSAESLLRRADLEMYEAKGKPLHP